MTYNVWNKWDKLETVMLGSCHPLEFYDGIKEDEIRDPLLRITEETLQELDYFKSVLKDFGCEVIQAPTVYDRVDTWGDKNLGNNSIIPRSSLQPRDFQAVIGNKCVMSYIDNLGIVETLKDYNSKDLIINPQPLNRFKNKQKGYPELVKQLEAKGLITPEERENRLQELSMWSTTSFTLIGNRLYFDTKHFGDESTKWFKSKFQDFEYVEVSIGEHNDACFAPIKPGAILSLYDIQTYEETFPGWDVCYLPDASWKGVPGWRDYKRKTQGKWWLPGEESNDAFIDFVNTWLGEWVGYVEETVFDVNVLVLDEHHVCVSNNKNETVNNFLKKHNMEPIHIPWRHRFFWDGGLHCITLDLKRQGKKENYFNGIHSI